MFAHSQGEGLVGAMSSTGWNRPPSGVVFGSGPGSAIISHRLPSGGVETQKFTFPPEPQPKSEETTKSVGLKGP